jgi:non-homologous end joining protein Ku
MARAIWKGTISFGLVNIPIALYPATRQEELKFRLLRKSEESSVRWIGFSKTMSSSSRRRKCQAAKPQSATR